MYDLEHLTPREIALMQSQRARDAGLEGFRLCYNCSLPFRPASPHGCYCSLRCKNVTVLRRRRDREKQNADGTGGIRPDLSHTSKLGPNGHGSLGYFADQLAKPSINSLVAANIELERQRMGLTASGDTRTEAEKVLADLGFTPKRVGAPVAPLPPVGSENSAPGAALNAPTIALDETGDGDTPIANAHHGAKIPT